MDYVKLCENCTQKEWFLQPLSMNTPTYMDHSLRRPLLLLLTVRQAHCSVG